MEKVKLTKEQADRLAELLKKETRSLIVSRVANGAYNEKFSCLMDLTLESLICALYIGYEVEKTPEEAAIEWCINSNCIARGHSAHDVVMNIKSILNQGVTT